MPLFEQESQVPSYILSTFSDQIRDMYDNGSQVDLYTDDWDLVLTKSNRWGAIKRLIRKGAVIENHWPILHQAISYYNFYKEKDHLDQYSRSEQDNLNMIKALLNRVNISLKYHNGFTALHLSVYINSVEISQLLIKKEANVNVQTNNGISPLHIAVKRARSNKNNTNIVSLLLENGANIEIAGQDGNTPLHYAVVHSLPVARLLIKRGAYIETRNDKGYTPLHLASSIEIAKLLIKHGANVKALSKNNSTVLHEVSLADIVDFFIKHRVNLNLKITKAKLHYTELRH